MREKNIPNTIDSPTSNNRSFHHYPPIYIPLSSRAFSRIRSSRRSARPTSLTFISPIWPIRLHMHRPCIQMGSMSIPRRGPRPRAHTNRYRHRYRHTLLVLLMRILLIRHLLLLRCRWSRTHTRRSSSHRKRYSTDPGPGIIAYPSSPRARLCGGGELGLRARWRAPPPPPPRSM